jgi:uncharacterized protein YndB with AHSA1/START domain
MSERSVTHSTCVIERTYPATPSRVFAAFASREAKGRWFIGPDSWERSDHELDFRVGGKEHLSAGPPGGPVHIFDALYQDIVLNGRIVSTYEMHLDDTRISVSLLTVEFELEGDGTRLIYTEQCAFLDERDLPESRQQGSSALLDNLGIELGLEARSAR